MRILEAYTPAQIRACGKMLEALRGKRSPEELIAFARTLRDPKLQKSIIHYRLLLPRIEDRALKPEEFLLAIGWETLRAWRKLEKELSRREISPATLREFIRSQRKKWLAESPSGWRKG